MPSFTLPNTPFPTGTSVSAYDAQGYSTFPAVPPGKPIATATVTGGSLTFTGLTDGVSYFAAAQVGGVWKGIAFHVGADGPPPGIPEDISYAGVAAGKALVVNESGDGYEFVSPALALLDDLDDAVVNLVLAPTSSASPALTIEQPAAGTEDGLVVKAGKATTAHLVTFTLSGELDKGPLFHWNKNGYGIVGDGIASPPYFAIQSGFTFDSVFKIAMKNGEEGRGVYMQVASETTAATPDLTLFVESNLILKPGAGWEFNEAHNSFVLVQAKAGFAVQDFAGTGKGQLVITRTASSAMVKASNVETGSADLNIHAQSNIIIKPAADIETENGYVLIQPGKAFAVQDKKGEKNLFVVTPTKLGFFGKEVAQQEAATLEQVVTALKNYGLLK